MEPLFLLGVHRMPAAAAREWQAQPTLQAVATTVQACPPCTRPHPAPPALPQFYNVERKWRRKLEGAMEADRTVGS